MSGSAAAPVIAGLTIGVVFVVVLSISITVSSNTIPTHPVLSVEQALPTVKGYLDANLPEILAPLEGREKEKLDTFGLLQTSVPEFRPVQLVFIHRNGTQFLIDNAAIIGRCNLTDENLCYTGDRTAQDYLKGHLIYMLEVEGKVSETIAVGGRYFVDANDGRLLHPDELT